MHPLLQDVKIAFRRFGKKPGIALVTLTTVALAVGANTAIFSIVHQVLLDPLPFREPERLVSLWELSPDDALVPRRFRVTAGNYFDWKEQARRFEDLALFGAAGVNWTGDGEPEQLLGARVTASYFRVLGIEPLLGRTFLPEENEPGRDRVLLLSQGLWQRRFGSSPDVIGRTLTLDGQPYEVVGVLPQAVYPTWPQATGRIPFLPLYQQIWIPMALSEERKQDRGSHVFGVLGRLAEGAALEEARAEMTAIAARLEAYPQNEGESVVVEPYLNEVFGGARTALLVLLGAVGLVLLIACANIASLKLASAADRQKEMAVRTALGAAKGVLFRQFLTESIVVAFLGGVVGVALAWMGTRVLIGLSPAEVPRLSQAHLSLPVVAFALGLSIVAGILVGLAPALQASRGDRTLQLKERLSSFGMRKVLVVVELTLAVVLVSAASLLVESFLRLREVDFGFSAENVLVADLMLPPSEYDEWQEISRFHREILDRLSSLPRVRSAALAYDHPLESNWTDGFRIEGGPREDEPLGAALRIVSPDYFRTMGIEVRRGRPFEGLDDPAHPGAVIVNEAFVRRYFAGADPLGKRLVTTTPSYLWGEDVPRDFDIVGVVADVRFLGPEAAPEPAFYLPAAQFPVQEMLVAIRWDGDAAAFAPRLREEIWSIDPDLPVSNATTMERLLSEALAQPRFNALVLGAFGASALALAGLGIYGLLSSTVAQRTSEIGIRMALGARARDVVAMVLRQGMRLSVLGIAIGVGVAWGSARMLESLLFGVSAENVTTYAVVGATLAGVAVLSCYLPARRAARIEPLRALRHE